MQELFFGPVATWFTVPALIGTVFFGLRTLAMLVGGGDTGVDADLDVDVDVDVDGDSSHSFRILSLQAIAAFMMGFGWGGLGAFGGGGWSLPLSVLFATACGVGMVWTLAKLLAWIYRLQSSGNVPMYHALEAEGTVYSGIPQGGTGVGRVRVVIDDREIFYRAVTDGEEELRRNDRIRVVGINDDNSVTVTKA